MAFDVDMYGSVTLEISDIWPDGDAPANPTAQDVADRMRAFGKKSLMDDWMLSDYLAISVTDKESKLGAGVF